ncbi:MULTISPECIES: anhydro-N-acetylmuramic acid kinase [Thalassotalea]|uniref:Anhydro-N-acetylmuramic acid kinase n=1 Tax=Thalassotalea castellviae TaxID=3075612 RepID=A0ABU2ZZ44_9GAMM|nr:anhydro-N-acetylmuramic acid kinase [Thalassotalea sp. W431]MDT0603189.1 anhydro-N-acetylmuramic acid kinase [Thalassotalea sp. W431]
MANNNYYIGVMSGTSADGVDIALVDFSSGNVQLKAHWYQAYNDQLHQKITALYDSGDNEIDRMGNLSVELAHYFSHAIHHLLTQEKLTAKDIVAIGCHGQTVRHRPVIDNTNKYPFTLQIGCHQTLACLTNIKVIGDFRTKDVALGGQGAPLVPAFHQYLFADQQQDTFIVNMGGIANITFLPRDKNRSIIGFDTGPANALLDAWCYKHTQQRYDENGQWAAQGNINQALLAKLLSDQYFSLTAPKSTGREYFNLNWLAPYLTDFSLDPVDVQATLSALTANSIAQEINKLSPKSFVYLCGGGIANEHCYKLIKHQLTEHCIKSINSLNLNNNAFEAIAFAWLAFAYEKKIYGNIPTVTGASRKTILGTKFYP